MPPAPAPDLGLAGERRQLTVFFCDLVGSMELAARLDPEDWPDVLWTYRTRAGEVVARHGGHVAQYFGDGILIYFGWPNTYDDTAELTARAALGLVEVAATGRADGTVLSVRVGLHTGPVVVRARGHSRREAREGRTRDCVTLASAETEALLADFLSLTPPTLLAISPDLQRRKTVDLLAQWTLA